MSDPNSDDTSRNPYLSTNERKEAVDAIEMTARFLEEAKENPDRWKWVMIALLNAVQAFMVLALQGTWNVTVLRNDQRSRKLLAQREFYRAMEAGNEEAAARANDVMLFGDSDLAEFMELYGRIKDPNGIMRQFVHSQVFPPRPKDDRCMRDLVEVRNEFSHFVPQRRSFLLSQFPAITESGLHVISFLVNESHNIMWMPGTDEDDFEQRVQAALRQAQTTLLQIQRDYRELPLPSRPLCGSISEDA